MRGGQQIIGVSLKQIHYLEKRSNRKKGNNNFIFCISNHCLLGVNKNIYIKFNNQNKYIQAYDEFIF